MLQNLDSRPAKASKKTPQDFIQLDESWKGLLLPEFSKPYMQDLKTFLLDEKAKGKQIYPPGKEMFAALNMTPFQEVRVVILGQDPYHGPNQAHGLSFSVREGIAFPPSLQNIFKELNSDLGIPTPKSGDLSPWAKQGVLLLNASLSVEQSKPLSHQEKGWEQFTDRIIHLLNDRRESLVFILWGSFAQKKAQFVDKTRHFVLTSPHPSPLSSYRGFFGSKPFSKANQYLRSHGFKEIDWSL